MEDSAFELVHGNELLAGAIHDYDRTWWHGQHQHTLPNILVAVHEATRASEPARRAWAYETIGGFVVLDALILNTDRHHENWGMFQHTFANGSVEYSMAPSFDHASSLGRELTAEKLESWSREKGHVPRYANKGRGGVFLKQSGRYGANPLRLAEVAHRTWPQYTTSWLRRLQRAGVGAFVDQLARLPDECIRQRSREFAEDLVLYTYEQLGRLL